MSPLEPSPLEEELEALRSIFGSDWVDLPPQKTAWNVKGEDGWWTVLVKGDDERVTAKIKGRCTKLYPRAPPILSIEASTGLSPVHVNTLNKLVNEKAKELSSKTDPAPFIFDIAYFVGEWLSSNHVPLTKPGETVPTLMEERAQREQAQKEAQVAQNQAQSAALKAQAEEQARLLNEKIQIDTSRKAQKANQAAQDQVERQRQENLAGLVDGDMEIRQLQLDEPLTVDGYDGSFSSWILFGGKRQSLWTSYTAEPDAGTVGFVKASLPTITVQVVDFSTPFYSTALGRKRVDAVAAELSRLKDIQSENVVRIYGVKRDKSPKGWERLIVMAECLVDGAKVRTWMPKDGFGEELAREYITQVLAGLVDVHRKGATQKQIDPDCILLSPRTSGEPLAKLSGTGYARRIADLHRSNPFLRSYEDTLPDSWLSPDELDSPYTYTAKRDIWHAGLLFVQMMFGQQALWKYPNLHILLQHGKSRPVDTTDVDSKAPGISESNVDLLKGLLHASHKKRLNAEDALTRARSVDEITRRGHSMSGSISSLHRHSSSRTAIISPSLPSPQNVFGTSPIGQVGYFSGYSSAPAPAMPRNSRYREDFEEVEFLGKGGFGEVVKARNRLDGRSYAIKKVKLRPEDNEAKVYREVNNLSRVSHQHVVRYHACWIEYLDRPESREAETSNSDAQTPTASVTDEASDIFALNFDDISRRDQSRSASFPRIRFAHDGADDEDDSDSDDDDDTESSSGETAADPSEQYARNMAVVGRPGAALPGRPSQSLTGTTTDDGAVQSILYIQMEFVEKQTLREAITAGLSEDEVWRILSQILQALAHMASLGIVHRDLKPSNILLDASGNVKIADFGLSTTDMTAMETAAAATVHDPNAVIDLSDRTSGIGTSLYIAPEVAISRSYNEKADMYSLGVIFFEMCFAFKTNMERVHILTALRQPATVFPDAWPKGVRTNQREIVEWLLRHDPNMRPRAEQLLASPLLPARENQKEFYDSAIAELTNPRSNHYSSLLHALFDPQTHIYTSLENRKDDYTFDNDNDHDYDLQVWLTVVTQRLVDLFQRHGAVETYLPLFIPETMLLDAFPDLSPVRVLDMSGKIIQLPSSGLLAMARSATRRQIERIKRYHVGHRYSEHAAGGQPMVSGQLSMDIISPIRSAAAEVEILDVVDKVVKEFRGGGGAAAAEYEFHVSHESVLACILGTVPEKSRYGLLKAFKSLASLGTSTASSRTVFTGVSGLPRHLVDELEQVCVLGDFGTNSSRLTADEFSVVRQKLEGSSLGLKRRLSSALETLSSIINLARACGITRKILFRPTLARNAEVSCAESSHDPKLIAQFFRGGFMFECVRRGRQRDLLAFGGRYDSLLEHFKAPSQHRARKVYGVGVSIAVDQLARMVRKHESALSARLMIKENEEDRSFGYWSPARCDVYVANTAQVDLASRLSIIGELWRAGIRADLQYDDERSLEEVSVECLEQNTLFLVIPRANRPVLKVRSVLKRSEEEIPRAELCAYLRQAIAEQRRIDANYASAEGSIPSAQAASLSAAVNNEYNGGKSVESDIKLLLPPEPNVGRGTKGRPVRKHRHATKSVYYDKASEFAISTATSLPILGVDLPSQLLSQLTLDPGWITDDEAWRAVLVGFSGEDRRYVDSVRDTVQSMVNPSSGPKTWLWLFTVREARPK